jgi:hypothetical protein
MLPWDWSREVLVSDVILHPCAGDILAACERFDEENAPIEKALEDLIKAFPRNTEIQHVLLKVMAINALYSTQIPIYSPRIPTLFEVADHIKDLNIDAELERQNPELVGKIGFFESSIKGKRFNYSFATKYCSFHAPDGFPIWDSRVDEYLWHLRKVRAIATFKREKLWRYPDFKDAVGEFRKEFGLTEFSFKQLDKFMYQEGAKVMALHGIRKSEQVSLIGKAGPVI